MKAYKSMMIKNTVFSIVEKQIYKGEKYWSIVKGNHFNNETIFKCETREQAIAELNNLWHQSKAA